MEFCLGTVQFGLKYGIASEKRPDGKECFNILDRAIERGIRTFDTARAYGNSEELLGEYFRGKDRKSFQIATKLETACGIEKALASSLKALKLDYVDFYLFHKGEMIRDEKAVEEMFRLKEKRLILKTGVSVYTPEEAMEAVKNPLIDCIQIPYNVIDRRLDNYGFFDIAEKSGKTVFCRSIFLQGLLFMNPEAGEKKLKGSGEVLEKYRKLCDRYRLSPIQFATSYIRLKKQIDYCIFGVDNAEQLEEQFKMQQTVLPEQALKDADMLFGNVDIKILDPRKW